MPSPHIDPCPAGHTYQHLGTPLRALYDAFWAGHATCEPTTDAVVGAANDGNGS